MLPLQVTPLSRRHRCPPLTSSPPQCGHSCRQNSTHPPGGDVCLVPVLLQTQEPGARTQVVPRKGPKPCSPTSSRGLALSSGLETQASARPSEGSGQAPLEGTRALFTRLSLHPATHLLLFNANTGSLGRHQDGNREIDAGSFSSGEPAAGGLGGPSDLLPERVPGALRRAL